MPKVCNIEFKGVIYRKTELCRKLNLSNDMLNFKLGIGWPLNEPLPRINKIKEFSKVVKEVVTERKLSSDVLSSDENDRLNKIFERRMHEK